MEPVSESDLARAVAVAADLLGVPSSATALQIKHAFRFHAERTHPDAHPGAQVAPGEFQRMRFAADVLLSHRRGRRPDDYKVRDLLAAVPTAAGGLPPSVARRYELTTRTPSTVDLLL